MTHLKMPKLRKAQNGKTLAISGLFQCLEASRPYTLFYFILLINKKDKFKLFKNAYNAYQHCV